MAVNFSVNNISMERLEVGCYTISILNTLYQDVNITSPVGSDMGWSCSDFPPDAVGFLPMDPFGMNMASLIGNSGDYWMDCFDSDAMLPLDPFGMSLETVVASLIEDFTATYGCCERNTNQLEDTGDYFDADNCSSSDDIFEIQSTLSAILAGLIEDFQDVSVTDVTDDRVVFDYWLDDTLSEEYTMVDCVLPSDPFDMESEYTSTAETSVVDVSEDLMNTSDYASSDANSSLSDWDIEGEATELMMGIGHFFDSSDSEVVCHRRKLGEGFLHEGLFYALGYMGIRDLLSVEMVCKSLRTAIIDDPLLWKCIKINSDLHEKITDDALLRLTQRAQGSLHCLSLVGCTKITDDGLKRILVGNPKLVKLCVPSCVKLSIGGIISNLQDFKISAISGIKHLKLGRLFNVSDEQYEELRSLLGVGPIQELTAKPRYFHIARRFLECDDDRRLDIEMCLVCKKYKITYDCTLESCKEKLSETCRACGQCIRRCAQCGGCIRDGIFKETFSLDSLCRRCWKNQTIW